MIDHMKKKAYLVGIKGVAMTALAVYLKESGYSVTGSDVADVFPTDKILKEQRIIIKKGFTPENITEKYDLVIVTGAHGGMTNIEAVQALKLNLPTFMHGVALGKFMNSKTGVSIAGCHGKTTTTCLIASLLKKGGFDPSYAIGVAEIDNLGPAGHLGKGNYFIAEADEYMTCPETNKTPRFLWQKPKMLVITNIEYDHPDAFCDLTAVKEAFLKLANSLPKEGLIVCCIDNTNVREILPHIKVPYLTYGFSPRADFQISKYYFGQKVSFMRLKHKDIDLGEYMLHIPGKHNLLNALAAGITVNQIGIGWEKIRELLKSYTGSKRRFEKKAEIDGVYLYDDYAHHPSEIVATIEAARDWFQDFRIIVVFQPHTYSRTKKLMTDFAKSFTRADLVVITDIYPSAREQYDPSINSQMLVIQANKYKRNVYCRKDKKSVLNFLKETVRSGDLIITMGAGDVYLWSDDIIKILKTTIHE